MRNWSNFWPEIGQISKWSRHFISKLAMSSVMGVLAMFNVWSMSNASTFFMVSLYHVIIISMKTYIVGNWKLNFNIGESWN